MAETSAPREWRTRLPSGSDFIALAAVLVGVASFVVAAIEAIAVLWFVGVWFLASGSWIASPCRRVAIDDAGTAVFTRWRRTLTVEPGALRSITRPAVLKYNPVMSMRVASDAGTIRYRAPVRSSDDLWAALASANPDARLMSPHAWLYERFSGRGRHDRP